MVHVSIPVPDIAIAAIIVVGVWIIGGVVTYLLARHLPTREALAAARYADDVAARARQSLEEQK